VLTTFLASDYFSGPAPKSLDRYDFPLDLVEHLSAEDAAATLVAFTAEAVVKAFEHGRARRPDRLRRRPTQSADHEGPGRARACAGQDRRGRRLARRRHRGRSLRLPGGADGQGTADQLPRDHGRGGADDRWAHQDRKPRSHPSR
jgi:hypothetical protein